mgnify:CR=1 FL=1
MIKYILTSVVVTFLFAVNAQNIKFKAGNFKDDKEGFKKNRWEQLDRKEKDYWRGRVQQWSQDRVMPNMQYSPRLRRSS